MAEKNTIWFGVADEVTASSATTTIVLRDDVYVYPVALNADTAIAFDSSQLNQARLSAGWGRQFVLLLKMGSTLRSVSFPNGTVWNCGITPTMNAASKNYLVRFEMYGSSISLGFYDGSFN